MAKIKLRPIEPLELEFEDGTVKKALFNNDAFILYEEEFGELSEFLMEDVKKDPYGATAKLLYCGLKVVDPNITLEEAEQMMYMGGFDLAIEVAECMTNNFNLRSNDAAKKKKIQMLQKAFSKEEMEILKTYELI